MYENLLDLNDIGLENESVGELDPNELVELEREYVELTHLTGHLDMVSRMVERVGEVEEQIKDPSLSLKEQRILSNSVKRMSSLFMDSTGIEIGLESASLEPALEVASTLKKWWDALMKFLRSIWDKIKSFFKRTDLRKLNHYTKTSLEATTKVSGSIGEIKFPVQGYLDYINLDSKSIEIFNVQISTLMTVYDTIDDSINKLLKAPQEKKTRTEINSAILNIVKNGKLDFEDGTSLVLESGITHEQKNTFDPITTYKIKYKIPQYEKKETTLKVSASSTANILKNSTFNDETIKKIETLEKNALAKSGSLIKTMESLKLSSLEEEGGKELKKICVTLIHLTASVDQAVVKIHKHHIQIRSKILKEITVLLNKNKVS